MTCPLYPKRGEVWRVDLNPSVAQEIRKQRPAVVISSDSAGRLPLKLIVPITGWQDRFTPNWWMVRVDPNPENGLQKPSVADTLQLRSVAVTEERFIQKLGILSLEQLDEIAAAIAATVEYQ